MKLTKQLEAEILTVNNAYWDSYIKGDWRKTSSFLDDNIKMIGSTEGEVYNNKKEATEFFKRIAKEIAGKIDMRNREIEIIPANPYVMVNEHLDLYIQVKKQWVFYSKVRLSSLLKHTEKGWKYIQQHSSVPDASVMGNETTAFQKITKENQELKEAVKRRTAEVEIKNRELAIEAALERVRARTMSMQHSDELPQAATLLFQQVQSLGMPAFAAGYCIWDDDKQAITLWMSSEGVLQPPFKAPTTKDELFIQMRKGYELGKSLHVVEMGGEDLVEHYRYMRTLPVVGQIFDSILKAGHSLPVFQVMHQAYFSKGFLLFITYEPVPQSHEIFTRFAKVFEQTYTRFLDLQKAEAQTRESQIQLALERVRARTMAMQKSEELPETSHILFEQMKEFGEPVEQLTIGIIDEENKVVEISATLLGETLKKIYRHSIDEPYMMNKIYKAWKRQQKALVVELRGDELNAYNKYRNELTHSEMFPTNFGEEHRRIVYAAFFSKGMLALGANEPRPPESIQLLERFASAFDLTYTRFLDLQKAEAQAREAQIEAALERVRSRTMAMHKSNELAETAAVLFEQMISLGIRTVRSYIGILRKESDEIEFWATGEDGHLIQHQFTGNIKKSATLHKMYAGWKQKQKSLTIDQQGKELEEYLHYLSEELHAPFTVGLQQKRRVQSIAYFSNGLIGIATPESQPEETIAILERFANVFDLTYRRFLDLQQAEAQAREAQIEASLERIRSKAMAMQTSGDLNSLVSHLFEEASKLNFVLDRCIVTIIDPQTLNSTWVLSNPETPNEPSNHLVQYHDHHPYLVYIDAWKKREEKWHYILEGEEKKNWDQFLFYQTELSRLPGPAKEGMQVISSIRLNSSFSNFGSLTLSSFETLTEPQWDILVRFTKVFDLTYTRFNDLKQAEAQAREAQIELALERIRAKTMAMHKSDEIVDIMSVMFGQFTQLNIRADVTGLSLDYKNDTLNFWTGIHGQTYPAQLRIPYINLPFVDRIFEAANSNKEFLSTGCGPEEKNRWVHHLFEHTIIKYEPEETRKFLLESPGLNISIAMGNNVAFIVGNYSTVPFSQEENSIIRRFKNVFEQSYIRFLDLQKAEAQAREAQIEAALERVRSRTMGMQKSEELKEVIQIVYEQFVLLNINTEHTGFILDYKTRDDFHSWIADKFGTPSQVTIPYFDCMYYNRFNEAKEKGIDFFTTSLSLEDKNRFYEDLFKYVPGFPEESKKIIFNQPGFTISTVLLENVALYIENFTGVPYSDEDNAILMRFGKIFQQTYTRFLDLQKAEAQAREAKIEAALEKIRSRSLAMQHSDELREVIGVTHKMLSELNVKHDTIAIQVFDFGSKSSVFWPGTNMQDAAPKVVLPFEQEIMEADTCHRDLWEAMATGEPIINKVYTKEQKDRWFEYVFAHNNAQVITEDARQFILKAETHTVCFFPEKNSGLFADSWDGSQYVEEDLNVLKRAARVFEQAYVRFLDLQKAEAQTREAKIEASLERVRARTMAMHNSEDVTSATETMFEEFKKLGIDNLRSGVAHVHPDRTFDVFGVTNLAGGSTMSGFGFFGMDEHPVWQRWFDSWINKEEVFIAYIAGPEKEEYFNNINNHLNYLPKKIIDFPDSFFQAYYFDQGAVWAYSLTEHTGQEKEIMKRFASVFSLTFRRYQDLKKAEAQAREALIEAAMEKVRARAMAMQKPNELVEVAELLRKEMGLLGVEELETSSIYIHDETSGTTECWYAIQDIRDNEKKLVADYMTINLNDTWVGREMMKFYNSDQKQVSILMQGENRKEWINYCAEHSKLLKGYYGDVIPERTYHLLKFSNGYIGAASPGDISKESWDLLKRATAVFSLAYTRFSDLQIAEASAKEAIKQAALDRIRADIASMRTISDLDRITPLIWNELNILGIPFIRCGVFIMDESQKLIHTFLSTPDGKAIAAFHLPYDTPGNLSKVLSHWKDHNSYIDHWDQSAFTEMADILVKQGAIISPGQYFDSIPHGGFYLHFLPFLQGMLYVGNTSQLGDDDIELIQHIADAFSTAYARYEDFNKLETAKQQVEKTLVDLKQAQQQLVQSEKMASLGELTAGIAHEIQNPLYFVNNFSDVSNELIDEMKEELAKGNIDDAMAIAEDVKQNLEKINHHGKRADGIVKGMLQHSRISAGQKEITDINILADEYLRLAYHGLRAKDKSFNAKFETDFDNTIDKINIIPQDIGRVILNLINNAFYAVTEKKKEDIEGYEPTVTVSTSKLNGFVEIRVIDNGIGIQQKVLDKIFQPFFTTKPTGQGTGLGLSLSYDIVKAHGGELKVETKEDKGSDFIVLLPLK